MSIEEVLEKLSTSVNGLSDVEAEKRLKEYGPNIIESKRKSPIVIFLRQFWNPLIIILVIASLISIILGELLDSILIIIVILIMGVMGFIQEYKAEKALEALRKLASPTAKVFRNGVLKVIDASRLVPGDIILVEEGDRVPADARLISSDNLEVDESPLTGESTPVSKDHSVVLPADTTIADRANMIYMGTTVLKGRGRGVVVATGPRTVIGGITRAVGEAKEAPTPLEEELEDLGFKLSVIILAIAAIVVATTFLLEKTSIITAALIGISLAVAAVPESLPAIATALLAIGARRMAERNAIVRKLAAVEALGSVDVICTDKTGTVTRGEMMVKYLWTPRGLYEFTGEGFKPEGAVKPVSDTSSIEEARFVGELAIAHTSHSIDLKSVLELATRKSPTELAVYIMGLKIVGVENIEKIKSGYRLVGENPFDRTRKMRSTIHEVSGRLISIVTGAPEVVLKRSTRLLVWPREEELTSGLAEKVMRVVEEYASQGFRTLALAYKYMENPGEDPEQGLVLVGILAIIDPPRESVRRAVEEARRMGVKTVIVTGDHKLTAMAVARMIGLEVSEENVLEGWQLDKMSDEELERVVDKIIVFARVTPEHKVRIVRALKKKGHRVAMTGDGVNDAPALKEADIGIAMGVRGTDVAKEASQLVLADDNYATIVEAIKMGRWIYENLKKPINYLLSCNLGEVATVFGAELAGLPYILEPVHILWVNLVTDSFPALALGLEHPEPDLFTRPPRPRGARLVTKRNLLYLALTGLLIAGFTIGFYAYSLDKGLEYARTVAFTTIVLSEFGRALASRSEKLPFWKLPANKLLYFALAGSTILQLVLLYTPLNKLFHTTPLEPHISIIIGLAPTLALLALDELARRLGTSN
ncbi:cation-translocating P-type ATPase [Thermogladius sp. 4427co]|uniref:cation-translocating P-type ATPase n=1 Tax=Thermogladius sp. 4427co TaxID=3450718 RepID=UPI003F7A9D8C